MLTWAFQGGVVLHASSLLGGEGVQECRYAWGGHDAAEQDGGASGAGYSLAVPCSYPLDYPETHNPLAYFAALRRERGGGEWRGDCFCMGRWALCAPRATEMLPIQNRAGGRAGLLMADVTRGGGTKWQQPWPGKGEPLSAAICLALEPRYSESVPRVLASERRAVQRAHTLLNKGLI